jgi:hypothetical protein
VATQQGDWTVVKHYDSPDEPIRTTRYFSIPPVKARFIRVQIYKSTPDKEKLEVRIDELEVIGKKPAHRIRLL